MLDKKLKDTPVGTIIIAALLCFVCSLVVSTAAVALKETQQLNKKIDTQKNILIAAGIEISSKKEIPEIFAKNVDARVIDIKTGTVVEDSDKLITEGWDQKKASKDKEQSEPIPSGEDVAGVKRRENNSRVYFIWEGEKLQKVIVPIRGYGLWSTLWGFLAVGPDGKTIEGITFYEHAETPGLGGEVDNPSWKAKWPEKKIYEDGEVAIRVIKGSVNENTPGAEHKVDGLAGATITSQGVENMMQYWLGENGFKTFLENVENEKFSPKKD